MPNLELLEQQGLRAQRLSSSQVGPVFADHHCRNGTRGGMFLVLLQRVLVAVELWTLD